MRPGNKSSVQQCTNECEGKRGGDEGGGDDMLEVLPCRCRCSHKDDIPHVKMHIRSKAPAGSLRAKQHVYTVSREAPMTEHKRASAPLFEVK